MYGVKISNLGHIYSNINVASTKKISSKVCENAIAKV